MRLPPWSQGTRTKTLTPTYSGQSLELRESPGSLEHQKSDDGYGKIQASNLEADVFQMTTRGCSSGGYASI